MLELGVSHLFGCSTQSTAYQQELRERVHLPYQLLSDEKLDLVKAAKMPTFEYNVRDSFPMLTSASCRGQYSLLTPHSPKSSTNASLWRSKTGP